MKDNKSASLFQKEQVIESLKQSFVKLNPRMMIKNPIMFTVEVATAVMFFVTLYSIVNASQGSFGYNIAVFVILFVTLLFANFAEAIAEARGKAQADSLRKTREETPAKKVEGNKIVTVSSSLLKKGTESTRNVLNGNSCRSAWTSFCASARRSPTHTTRK